MKVLRWIVLWTIFGGACLGMVQDTTIDVTGVFACLPKKDASGPQTQECAFGLRDDQGRYFAIRDSDARARNLAGLPMGGRIRVQGSFAEGGDSRYATQGVITVALLVQINRPALGLALPEGGNAWSITVRTSGGFTGGGRGNVSMTSTAQIACESAVKKCPEALAPADRSFLEALVPSVRSARWPDADDSFLSRFTCSDCIVTTISLAYRDGGRPQVIHASWDDVTRSRVPPEFVRLSEFALSLAK